MRNWRDVSLAASLTLFIMGLGACSANGGRDVEVVNPSTPSSKKILPPTVKLSIKPSSLLVGQTAVATWVTTNATTCTAVGAWGGTVPTQNNVGVTIGPMTTPGVYSYGANCVGPGGSGTATVIVTVGQVAAPTIQFTITPDSIVPGGSALITWSTTNATGCTGTSGEGTYDWEGVQPTENSAGFNTKAISTAGQYAYDLTCLGPGGSTQVTGILTVDPAAPAATPTVSFSATPTVVQPGQATAFSWTSTGATACKASGGSGADAWNGSQPLNSTGTPSGPIASAGSYSYTLTCTGAGGSTAQSAEVVVNATAAAPPVTVAMSISPAQIVAGNSAALTWSTSNASACTASGSWSGTEPLLGTAVSTGTLVTPGVYSYTLSCTGVGGGGSQIDTLTVAPAPAVVNQFAASPTTVTSGGSTTLSWTTIGATACSASGGSPGDSWTGTEPVASTGTNVTPNSTPGTYIYTLSCTGQGGVSSPQSLSVTVVSPTPSPAGVSNFTATPSTVQVGQAAMLAWSTTNATSCTATNGTGSWGGSTATSSSGTSTGNLNTAGSYTYTLTCNGPGGTGSADSVVVNVNPSPAPTPAPTITSFAIQPNPIQIGQSASLSWATTGASGCTATGGTGSDGWNGSMPASSSGTSTGNIGTANTYTYTLTCASGGTYSAPSSVTLNVTAAPQPAASITSFTASPSTLQTGGATQLAWTTTGASSCSGTGGSTGDGWAAAQNASNTGFTTGTLNTVGQFVYTLTCTGPGGSSSPQSVTVDVSSAPAAATITAFSASPTSLASGGYSTFTWSSSNATSCAGTGGTGSDGWTSVTAASSTGTSIGPINQTGSVNYTLTCTGPGGSSTPSTTALTVSATAPAATVSNFSASPSTVQSGQPVSLAWSSSNASSCVGSGGTGSWAANQPLQSTGTSSGALGAVGTYVFTLVCTGPGGVSAPATATVSAITATPAAAIGSFAATPSSLQTGQSTSLTWTTTNATSCTASGGDNADGWNNSTEPVSSTGTPIGPINTAGNYIYTLTCSGSGGTSTPSSINVTVTSVPPTPTIASFTATPSTITAGGYTSLAWSSSNASTCTPGGGTGSDGWTGAQAPSSMGVSAGPLSSGPVTYTLTCTGSGVTSAASSATVTVNPVVPAAPTVALSVGSSQIQTNATASLSWSSTNATSCVASGGASGDGWAGSRSISSTGTSVGPITAAGTYTYTLTCTGGGGSGSASVQVTVANPTGYDCGIPGLTTEALVAPAVTVTSAPLFLCVGCTTYNGGGLIDATVGNYATISIPVGVAGAELVSVNGSTVYPAGTTVGFVVANGVGLIDLSLLGGLAVQTSLAGNVQQTAVAGGLLQLQAAGLLGVDQYAGFVGFTTSAPFDSVGIAAGALLSLGATWNVYSACVSH